MLSRTVIAREKESMTNVKALNVRLPFLLGIMQLITLS
jgi:hypothetical protein